MGKGKKKVLFEKPTKCAELPEDIVCPVVVSLELSKQLKEAGYPQEGKFWWGVHKRINEPDYSDCINLVYGNSEFYPAEHWETIDAPLASELMERLPYNVQVTKGSIWQVSIYDISTGTIVKEKDISLPNALAKMYLYLKQKGLL